MIKKLSQQQAKDMLKFYTDSELRIKRKLAEAIKNKRDTTYLRNLLRSINQDIKELDDYFKYFSSQELKQTYKKSGKELDKVIEQAKQDGKIDPKKTFNRANQSAIKVLSQNTYNSLSSITDVIGRKKDDLLREAGIRGVAGIVEGSEDVRTATNNLIMRLEGQGFFNVVYSNGKKMPARAYATMVARTTSAEAFRVGTTDRIKGYDYDLVDVIGVTSYPKSPCIPFEHKTLSLSGKTKGYVSLTEARAAGLFHPNCIHDLGLSEKNFDLEAKQEEPKPEPKATPKKERKPKQEKPKAPKTIAEVLEDTKKLVSDKVSIKKITNVESLSQFNETLAALYEKYPTDKVLRINELRTTKGTMASANAYEISLSPRFMNDPLAYFNKSVTNYKKSRLDAIEQYEKALEKHKDTAPVSWLKKVKKEIKNYTEDLKYERHNVIYEKTIVKDVVTHEYAHVLSQKYLYPRYRTFSPSKWAAVQEAYHKAMTNGDIYKISKYGSNYSKKRDIQEFFAESFTLREAGVEKLPDYINNMIDEVLKK